MLHSNSAHNLFRVCSNTTCIHFQPIIHTDPYTSMTFSGKQLPGYQETILWNLIPAPRNHILENRNQINPSFKVFKKNKIDICQTKQTIGPQVQFQVQSTRVTECSFRLEHYKPGLQRLVKMHWLVRSGQVFFHFGFFSKCIRFCRVLQSLERQANINFIFLKTFNEGLI